MKAVYEFIDLRVRGGARVWRIPLLLGARTCSVLLSEGNLDPPTDEEIANLPTVVRGRTTPDDARSQIETMTNVAQLGYATEAGDWFFGHATDVYQRRVPDAGVASHEETVIRNAYVPGTMLMRDSLDFPTLVRSLGGTVVARAKYGMADMSGQLNPTFLNRYNAEGQVVAFRSWDARSVPDGWAEVNFSDGSFRDRWLLFFGTGRGGFRAHNNNSRDTGHTVWDPNQCYHMAETGSGFVPRDAGTAVPQIVADAVSYDLRGLLIKRDPYTMASGPAPHFSTGLVAHGIVSLPIRFVPQWGGAVRLPNDGTVSSLAEEVLSWPGRAVAWYEEFVDDGTVRLTGKALAQYFTRAVGRKDRTLALTPAMVSSLDRLSRSGQTFTYQWSVSGFMFTTCKRMSSDFDGASGSDELIRRTDTTPRYTIDEFDRAFGNRRVYALLSATTHGPGTRPLQASAPSDGTLLIRDVATDGSWSLAPGASPSAVAAFKDEVIGDATLIPIGSEDDVYDRMFAVGLGSIAHRLEPDSDSERQFSDVTPLAPAMASASTARQCDAYLGYGYNLNADLARAMIGLRTGERTLTHELSRRYDYTVPLLNPTH